MRKLFSIVFIVLLLMNVMGYYGVFMGLTIRQDTMMLQRLDLDNFQKDQLISLKIPMSLPYATDAEEYNRVDGKFAYNGEVYRLLKQKLSRDTLSIICVRDSEAKKINTALATYLKTFSDTNAAQQSGKIVLSLIKDYIPETFELCTQASLWEQKLHQSSFYKILIPSYIAHVVHPPERA